MDTQAETASPPSPTAPPKDEPQKAPIAAKFPWQVLAVFALACLAILGIVVLIGLNYLNSHADEDETDWDQMLILFAFIVNPVTLILGAIFGFAAQSPQATTAADAAAKNGELADKNKEIAEKNFDAANTALREAAENAKIGENARTLLGLLVQSIDEDGLDVHQPIPDINLNNIRGVQHVSPADDDRSIVERARRYLEQTDDKFVPPEAWSSAVVHYIE